MPPHHSTEELRAWVRLSLEPGLGQSGLVMLLATLGLPQDIYCAPVETLACYVPMPLARQMAAPPSADTLAIMDAAQRWVESPGHRIVTLADPDYPPSLLTIADPPPLLYVLGNVQALAQPSIAVVGARNATAGGQSNARAFAQHLADQGWCIVSGLARGIDAAAHEGALDASAGNTVAVLGTGIDRIYPRAHQHLAERIAVHGAVISELPLGAAPLPFHFPRRNRIVAGLSRGVLVVEAARQSGSLSTAQLATENGREVFAIPGSIHSPLSRGCHALIRQGAKLVETAQDIADELTPASGSHPSNNPHRSTTPSAPHHRTLPTADDSADLFSTSSDATADPLLKAMGHDPVLRDELQRRTGLDDANLQARLLELELDNLIERLPGERYQRLP